MAGSYEPISKGGYPMDELVSSLQKCVRRGLAKDALHWALELNEYWPDYTWKRLLVIAAEDIGPANPELVNQVATMARTVMEIRKQAKNKKTDPLMLSFIVLQMARSPKSREADDFYHEVVRERRLATERKEIPDFGMDMHTKRGRAMGRDIFHFLDEGIILENELYPSNFLMWDPELGCSCYDGQGNLVSEWPGNKPEAEAEAGQDELL